MIYALHIYTATPGRMDDLLRRFRDHVLPLMDRHGIKQAGFWTGTEEATGNVLTYFTVWESMADHDLRWTAALNDPAWKAAQAESTANGPLVASTEKRFMTPTDFSSVQ